MKDNVIPQPFRFLDLPAEMRLMVYEAIPFTKRYIKPILASPEDETIILVSTTYSLSLLASCRLIKSEASPILDSRAASLAKQPIRFIMQLGSLRDFSDIKHGILHCIMHMAEMTPGGEALDLWEKVTNSPKGQRLKPYFPLIEQASQRLRKLRSSRNDDDDPLVQIVVLGCPTSMTMSLNGNTTHDQQVHDQLEDLETVCSDFDAYVSVAFREEESALAVAADKEPLWTRCECFLESDIVKALELEGPDGWERDWLEGDVLGAVPGRKGGATTTIMDTVLDSAQG